MEKRSVMNISRCGRDVKKMSIQVQRLIEHQELIEETKELFRQACLENMQIFEIQPIPDLIVVDFERKIVFSIECSFNDERCKKKNVYEKSDFKDVVFVRRLRDYPNIKPQASYNSSMWSVFPELFKTKASVE